MSLNDNWATVKSTSSWTTCSAEPHQPPHSLQPFCTLSLLSISSFVSSRATRHSACESFSWQSILSKSVTLLWADSFSMPVWFWPRQCPLDSFFPCLLQTMACWLRIVVWSFYLCYLNNCKVLSSLTQRWTAIFGVQMQSLKGYNYAYASFILLLLICAGGTFLYYICRPRQKRRENQLKFDYK